MTNRVELRGKKVLVVGGAGFVGSNLVKRLLDREELREILIVDNLLSSERWSVPEDSRVSFLLGSIADTDVLDRLPRDLAVVFHLACYHGNQSSITDPIADHDNNLITSLRLFDRLSSNEKLESVVYSAAGCGVAEKTDDEPTATSENAPVSMYQDSPYSISKIVGELYGNYYWARHGLPFIAARFQNVYGPGEILGAGRWRGTPHTVWRNVVPTFVWKALKGESLPLENGGRGSRDFIYVGDVVDGLIACARRGVPGNAYNLASGVEMQISELAAHVNRITMNGAGVERQPARDWDRSGRRYGSTEKSERELGFRASVSIEEGLSTTIDWMLQHRDQIQATIQKHASHMEEVPSSPGRPSARIRRTGILESGSARVTERGTP
jgi:UDP-glucose 4-epimerase